MYGSTPSLLVFARRVDGGLAGLAGKLDHLVGSRPREKVRAAIIACTTDAAPVTSALEALAREKALARVPLCVTRPAEALRGPGTFDLDPGVAFTVVAYDASKKIRLWMTLDALDDAAQERVVAAWSRVLDGESGTPGR